MRKSGRRQSSEISNADKSAVESLEPHSEAAAVSDADTDSGEDEDEDDDDDDDRRNVVTY